MTNEERLRAINQALEEQGLRWAPSEVQDERYRWEGEFHFGQHTVRFAFVMADLEFVRPPKLELRYRSEDLPETIAHLEGNGYCYARVHDFVLDRYAPRSAVLECLSTMKAQVEGAFAKNQTKEIADEFPLYWGGPIVHALTPLEILSEEARLHSVNAHVRMLTEDRSREAPSSQPVAIIRFDKPLTFPGTTRPPTRLGAAADWLDIIEPGLGERMLSICSNAEGVRSIVIVGANTSVGFDIEPSKAYTRTARSPAKLAQIIRANRASIPISRFRVEASDPTTILKRNYPLAELLGKKSIVLVGLGAIGGYVCDALVRSGAGSFGGRLTLIDPDALVAGNLGRHHLGMDALGLPKVLGCANSARVMSPNIGLRMIGKSVVNYLNILPEADLVIDATGEEAVSYAINEAIIGARRARGADKVATLIAACIFGNGAAAQAYLFDSQADACLRCLHPRLDNPWRFGPMTDDLNLEVVAGPCGEGTYVPYNCGAPLAATALVMATVDSWLRKKPSPRLKTTRVDHGATRSRPDKDPSASANCPACGSVLIELPASTG